MGTGAMVCAETGSGTIGGDGNLLVMIFQTIYPITTKTMTVTTICILSTGEILMKSIS